MFKRFKNQPQSPLDFPDCHSLELIFDLVKECRLQQRDQSERLDTKAYFIVTTATTLVSAALVLQAVLPSSQSPLHTSTLEKILQILPLSLLLLTYLGVMITALAAYQLRSYGESPNPTKLYQEYLMKSERYTKRKVLNNWIQDFKRNDREIGKKIKWNKRAIQAFWIEIILFVAFLLLHAIN